MPIVQASDLRYLIFGGGGGRGWAHIGAIRELEAARQVQSLVPWDSAPRSAGSNSAKPPAPRSAIEGVAGASVGAFVALCVALGASAKEIAAFARMKFARNRLTLVSDQHI